MKGGEPVSVLPEFLSEGLVATEVPARILNNFENVSFCINERVKAQSTTKRSA